MSTDGAPDVPLGAALEAWHDDAAVNEGLSRSSVVATLTAHALAVTFLALAVACVPLTAHADAGRLAQFAALVALYVVAFRVEFTASAGSMVPTQPVLVALLVVGPAALVPVGVLVGVLMGSIGRPGSGAGSYGWAVRVLPAWHSLGPVAVLLAAGSPDVGPGTWWWLALGTAVQFTLDTLVAVVRMASLGVNPLVLLRPLWWTFRIDALMGVIGALVVFGAAQAPAPVVVGLVAVPIELVRILGRDRAEQVDQSRSLGAAFHDASLAAVRDPMTGLGNRRRWEQAVAEVERRRQDEPSLRICVVMADLDGLKYANDTYGHETGDALIRAFADVLVATMPATAVIARLGGDEFGVLVAGEHGDGDRLLRDVRAGVLRRDTSGGIVPLSASLGWACVPPLRSVAEAAAAADEHALMDKRRRRVGRSTDAPPPTSPTDHP